MSLHLTTAEWAAIAAAGSGVLFRAAVSYHSERCSWTPSTEGDCRCRGRTGPDLWMEAAAQPCETCGGDGGHNTNPSGWYWIDCVKCNSDGKRRIAVVVPCCGNQRTCRDFSRPHCAWRTDGTADGLVTVGHVVVESGPDLQDDGRYRLAVRVVG